jgi:hypothetical protein
VETHPALPGELTWDALCMFVAGLEEDKHAWLDGLKAGLAACEAPAGDDVGAEAQAEAPGTASAAADVRALAGHRAATILAWLHAMATGLRISTVDQRAATQFRFRCSTVWADVLDCPPRFGAEGEAATRKSELHAKAAMEIDELLRATGAEGGGSGLDAASMRYVNETQAALRGIVGGALASHASAHGAADDDSDATGVSHGPSPVFQGRGHDDVKAAFIAMQGFISREGSHPGEAACGWRRRVARRESASAVSPL